MHKKVLSHCVRVFSFFLLLALLFLLCLVALPCCVALLFIIMPMMPCCKVVRHRYLVARILLLCLSLLHLATLTIAPCCSTITPCYFALLLCHRALCSHLTTLPCSSPFFCTSCHTPIVVSLLCCLPSCLVALLC